MNISKGINKLQPQHVVSKRKTALIRLIQNGYLHNSEYELAGNNTKTYRFL